MIITNAVRRGRTGTWDVHIENAKFGSIVASPADSEGRTGRPDTDVFDAVGRLLVEPFVDAHVHLDYSNTVGQPRPNESGTSFEAIEIGRSERKRASMTLTRFIAFSAKYRPVVSRRAWASRAGTRDGRRTLLAGFHTTRATPKTA